MANTTWSTTDKTAGITLSGGDLTATASAGGNQGVRAKDGQSAGKFYWEVTSNSWNSSATGTGVAPSTINVDGTGTQTNFAYITIAGNVVLNGGGTGISLGARANGDIISIALDVWSKLVWFRVAPSGNWNGSGTANPATGTGGLNIGATAAPMFPYNYIGLSGHGFTANFGDSTFSGAVPSGYTSGWPAAVPTTTWNPGDRNSQVTLSGGNLVATTTTFSIVGARAIDAQFSGKFYWECTQTSAANNGSGVGFFSSNFNLMTTFLSGGAIGACGVHRSGQVYSDGTYAGVNFGTIANGTVICIAIDCTARLVWFRLGAAGNWNNSVAANPVTGAGGIATSLGLGIPVYPAVSFGNTPDQYTANFGASAFTGTVPSGFTSGWPAGFTAPMRAALLVHADGANGSTTFTDETGNIPLTVSGAVVTTTSPKFGTGSASFPTSAAWIAQASGSTTSWNFRGGPFTVEAWARFTSTPTTNQGVVTQWGGAGNLGWFLGLVSGSFNFYYSTTGGDNPFVGAAFSPTLNQWYHVAADRDVSNVLRVYIDGVVIASATVSAGFFDSTRNLVIGNDQNLTRGFPGQLDEIRVTKGFARYGGAFTPPTAAFSLDPNPFTNVLTTQVAVEQWIVNNPDAQVTQVMVEHWTSVQTTYPPVTNPSLVLSGSRAGIGSVVVSR